MKSQFICTYETMKYSWYGGVEPRGNATFKTKCVVRKKI